jgi:hypothetical protein
MRRTMIGSPSPLSRTTVHPVPVILSRMTFEILFKLTGSIANSGAQRPPQHEAIGSSRRHV